MAMSQYAAPSYGKRGYVFPTFAIVIGNVFATAPLGVLVAVGVWEILKTRGNIFQVILSIFLQPLVLLLGMNQFENSTKCYSKLLPIICEKVNLQ